MARKAITVMILFLCMIIQPAVANISAPNDTQVNGNSVSTLSIDGFVTTKFASVGSQVDIQAYTMGHSDNAIVSADIVQYDISPLDSIINSAFPGEGKFLDRVVLQSNGLHDNDSSIMTWQGSYTIPVTSTGGLYGAKIFVEDGNRYAVDDPTQIREIFRVEFEKVLSAIDTAWDSANPLGEIANEFTELETKGTSNGGWSNFVAVATDGSGAGGSRQLWNSMLDAGHNQYNMSAGSNFLEALMVMLDSDDADAGIQFVVGLMTYLDNLPLPRSMYDFDDLSEYIQTFDVIENLTRFEGTGDFEAAYNALIGSNEWDNLSEALDNLAEGIKPFESAQTLMRNIALLAVSDHPQAIVEGLTAWVQPLIDGDFENMTPFQQFVVRFAEMAGEINGETDIQDLDDDGAPDVIRWQYEYLLDTTEGQAWTARMESDSPWVNDAFDDFNNLPEDIIQHVFDAIEHPILNQTGEVLAEFGSWMNNASRSEMNSEWPMMSEDDDEDGDDSDGDEGPQQVIFEELYPMRTTDFDSHLLEVGIKLDFDRAYCEGETSDIDEDTVISIAMTNDRGYQVSTDLVLREEWSSEYVGVLLAPALEDTTWTLSQPLAAYDSCDIERAYIEVDRSLRPSMLSSMALENNDETFVVSAVGVLVDQSETGQVGTPFTVSSQTYDSSGIISDAEADIAILRISPQLGQSAAESLSPVGEHFVYVQDGSLTGEYTGDDLDGDLTIQLMQFGNYRDRDYDRNHPQSYYLEDVEVYSNGNSWDVSNYLPSERGLADLLISGTTTEGIEFSHFRQIALPGALGCASTQGNSNGNYVDMGYEYRNFENDMQRYDKPDLQSVNIQWGDGASEDFTINDWEEDPSSWASHEYQNSGTYGIDITFTDEFGTQHTDSTTYDTYEGFWQEDSESEDGGYWTGWKGGSNCYLEWDEQSTPSPQLIDTFITDGPFEVVTEQIMSVDSEGVATLTFTPEHPGVYLTIVQSEGTLDSGEIKTGIGLNFAYITNGELLVSGLEQVTTFAGLPVYIADSSNNGLNTITIEPRNIEYSEFNATIGVAPIKLDIAFPDIDWDSIGEPDPQTLNFQTGDTSRNQELRFEAPMSLLGIAVLNPDGQIMAEAIHFGIVLKDPSQLDMMGSLGPGQTTNIALNAEDGEASRIFAVAVPKLGFDPASIDFASFTSLVYEGIRENVGWVAENEKSERVCEEIQIEPDYESQQYNHMIYLQHRYDSEYRIMENLIDTSNVVLTDSAGNEVQPIQQMDSSGNMVDWKQSWEGSSEMTGLFNLDSNEEYTLTTNTDVNSEFEIRPYEYDSFDNCDANQQVNQDDAFALFDEFFADVNSIAWGIGSSADLTLPHLASPTSNYTVLAMVQQGTGSTATISAAIGSQIAEPNPEPLVMKNITIDYMPENPSSGDTMLITITEEDTGLPVDMLSVVVIEDGFTIGSDLTDQNGQTAFVLFDGTFLVRASGGMYNAAEFTITVTQDGSQVEESLDTDGDGISDVLDYDDDDDGVDDIYDLCPDTPIGDIVDNNGCTIVAGGNDTGDEVDDENDETDMSDMTECETWEANNPQLIDTSKPGNGCPYLDSDEKESTSDSAENQILGMDPITLGAIVALLIAVIAGVLMFVRKGNTDQDWYEQEALFEDKYQDTAAMIGSTVSMPPSSPPPNHTGYMQDGYEVTEYPEGSGNWWWKDPATGRWSEWK